jgi:hypothetical protein
MNKGRYVGYTFFREKKHYLKIDGYFSFDVKEARCFQSADEALSATKLDSDMIVFSELLREEN